MLCLGSCAELIDSIRPGPNGAIVTACYEPGCDRELKDTEPERGAGTRLSKFAYALGWRVCRINPDGPASSGFHAAWFCPVHCSNVIDLDVCDQEQMERAFIGVMEKAGPVVGGR